MRGSTLISHKVQMPPQPERTVLRTRLIEILKTGVPAFKLTLVSAPAGYGKTTLLAQWAHTSQLPVIWLSISKEDNEVEHFLRHLLSGWEQTDPAIGETKFGLLLGAMLPDMSQVVPALLQAASKFSDPLIFILDDYHHINEETVHQMLAVLIDQVPVNFHFVLASRGEPPLPLPRYRTRDQVLEIRTPVLRFLPDETKAFMQLRGVDLNPEEINSLHMQTEGWAAGLQLAALSLQRQLTDIHTLEVSGRQRFIADFLREDVLANLPAETREFLLQTAVLDRLCGALCDAVTGGSKGQKMLEQIEREGLFLMPLDDSREWYRYHPIFADYLQQELKRRHPEQVTGLHKRASGWYLPKNMPELAFRHALEGNDPALVLRVFERYFQPKLMGGEFKSIKRWLDSIPPGWEASYPMFGLVRTGFLLFTGQVEKAVHHLDEVEQQVISTESEDTSRQLARVNAIRCSIACFQNNIELAESFAEEAIQDLPEEDSLFRSILYGSLGDTYRRNGFWAKARERYLQLRDLIDAPDFQLESVHVFGALADLALRQGHLNDAAGYWRKAFAAIEAPETWGRLPLPLTGWIHIRMAELLYEWNALEEAREHLTKGLELAELGGDVRAMIAGHLTTGSLALAKGNQDNAAAALERARPLISQAQFTDLNSRFERLQAELWLAQDRLRAAIHWADKMLQGDALQKRPESEAAQLGIAHVLVTKGDTPSLDQALALLARLLKTAEAEGRKDIIVEALVLQSMVYEKRGAVANAMNTLARALRLGEPEGYIRTFVDFGLPMVRLLQETRSRKVFAEYVETLLGSFDGGYTAASSAARGIPEPLTPREQEVLQLLAAGLTNKEIAAELVISPGTVKKHTGNIYSKLNVGSRSEAAARARELDLLD